MEVFNEKTGAFGKGGAFVRGFFGVGAEPYHDRAEALFFELIEAFRHAKVH